MPDKLDTDVIQLRRVYAREVNNSFVPSSFILIAGGDGTTKWNSVSTIIEISSFKTVKGNSPTTYSADLSNNLLHISTTGIEGILESYIDLNTKTLMLSNYLPPFEVSQGSVPTVNNTVASIVPNPRYLQQVTGQSTIKFLGVGDIQFSTITSQNAAFISISSFTSVGYSTISGETFNWRPTLFSTLSTSYGRPSFISSIPFISGINGWNLGSNLEFSTPTNSQDMYFSSITFQLDNIVPYIDVTKTSSTRIFLEYNPVLIMQGLRPGPTTSLLPISTFIQIENGPSGLRIFEESVITNYMVSQQTLSSGNSNYFTTPMRIEINPYTSFLSNYELNNRNTINMTIYHRFPGANTTDTYASNTGFSSVSTITNFTPKTGGLYINLINQSPVF